MRKRSKLSEMPSAKLVAQDRAPYEKQREALVAQIDSLQALYKAERLANAKLALKVQELTELLHAQAAA